MQSRHQPNFSRDDRPHLAGAIHGHPASQSDEPAPPKAFSDRIAVSFTKVASSLADTFFAKRDGHRAVVLEMVAAVPGMVGATLQHLKALRPMQGGGDLIRIPMDEAENARMQPAPFRASEWRAFPELGSFSSG